MANSGDIFLCQISVSGNQLLQHMNVSEVSYEKLKLFMIQLNSYYVQHPSFIHWL